MVEADPRLRAWPLLASDRWLSGEIGCSFAGDVWHPSTLRLLLARSHKRLRCSPKEVGDPVDGFVLPMACSPDVACQMANRFKLLHAVASPTRAHGRG